ncbi:MAG: DUF3221 domain-containing protein [Longimicrobiales bacterium]
MLGIGGRRLALGLGLALGPGCAGGGFEPPTRGADIEGVITRVTPASGEAAARGDALGTVLVEEEPGTTYGSRKISFKVTAGTRLLRWNADAAGYGTFEFTDLRVGARVRAWADGPIAESYPEQATAGTLVM